LADAKNLHGRFFHVSMHYLPRDDSLEFAVSLSLHAPASIRLLSAVICHRIVGGRHVKSTAARATIVALVGPIAIAWVLAAKPEQFHRA
jgi:hypothetical protein